MKIDHVELFVPDRDEAAEWYGQVLGFEVLEQHRHWAVEGGPLMISNDGGDTMVALFAGEPQGDAAVRGLRRLAFRVGADDFLRFLDHSDRWRKEPLGQAEIQDHEEAISVYFSDPWGTPLEVTTYEVDSARPRLAS